MNDILIGGYKGDNEVLPSLTKIPLFDEASLIQEAEGMFRQLDAGDSIDFCGGGKGGKYPINAAA